jgi:hypothetical protein
MPILRPAARSDIDAPGDGSVSDIDKKVPVLDHARRRERCCSQTEKSRPEERLFSNGFREIEPQRE